MDDRHTHGKGAAMAEARTQVSILRITGALLIVGVAFGGLGAAFLAGRETGAHQQRLRAWNAEVDIARWRSIAAEVNSLDFLEEFALTDRIEGDAVPLYWPAGISSDPSTCRRPMVRAFDSDYWDMFPVWHEAAQCDRIDAFVEAARMTRMDLSDWLAGLDPAMAPGNYSYFGVHRAPVEDMQAAVARAHERIEAGDLDGAEHDARAVVSAGMHFMRGSVDVGGMGASASTVFFALDHLREIAERRNDAVGVTRAADAMERVNGLRTALFEFDNVAYKAAALPLQLDQVMDLARDENVAIAFRMHAAMAVGYASILNPVEVAFGATDERRRLIEGLESDPVLAVAAARAREPFELGLRARIRLFASAVN